MIDKESTRNVRRIIWKQYEERYYRMLAQVVAE